jgi:hypothetical protein
VPAKISRKIKNSVASTPMNGDAACYRRSMSSATATRPGDGKQAYCGGEGGKPGPCPTGSSGSWGAKARVVASEARAASKAAHEQEPTDKSKAAVEASEDTVEKPDDGALREKIARRHDAAEDAHRAAENDHRSAKTEYDNVLADDHRSAANLHAKAAAEWRKRTLSDPVTTTRRRPMADRRPDDGVGDSDVIRGIETFAAGEYDGDADGEKWKYSDDDIATIARNFKTLSAGDKPVHRVPVAVTHDQIHSHGWVKAAAAKDHADGDAGALLTTDWEHVSPGLRRAIKDRSIRKVSAEIKTDFADRTGKVIAPGPYLYRIVVLGADVPRVKGLEDIPATFADGKPGRRVERKFQFCGGAGGKPGPCATAGDAASSKASEASKDAFKAGVKADRTGKPEDHAAASAAHVEAHQSHLGAMSAHLSGGDKARATIHDASAETHAKAAHRHQQAAKRRYADDSGDTTMDRAAAITILTDAGVDPALITDQTPDELLISMAMALGGGAADDGTGADDQQFDDIDADTAGETEEERLRRERAALVGAADFDDDDDIDPATGLPRKKKAPMSDPRGRRPTQTTITHKFADRVLRKLTAHLEGVATRQLKRIKAAGAVEQKARDDRAREERIGEVRMFCDRMAAEGRISPADNDESAPTSERSQLVLMAAQPQTVHQFADPTDKTGQRKVAKTLLQLRQEALAAREVRRFSERVRSGGAGGEGDDPFANRVKAHYDRQMADLDRRSGKNARN